MPAPRPGIIEAARPFSTGFVRRRHHRLPEFTRPVAGARFFAPSVDTLQGL